MRRSQDFLLSTHASTAQLLQLAQAVADMLLCAVLGRRVSIAQNPEMVTREHFGTLPDGTPVDIITIRNARGLELSALTYGCLIVAMKVPDADGKALNVVLGYEGLE